MKRHHHLVLTTLALAALTGCAAPSGIGRARRLPPLEITYGDVIDALLPGMGAEKLVDREDTQSAFETICHRAGGRGDEARRRALCRAIIARLGPETAKPARVWLLRKIEPLGREEAVEGLAALFDDDDPRIRELARRALQNNPTPSAARALRDELASTDDPDWQIALINALGARRDSASVDQIAGFTDSDDNRLAWAAVAAMGDVGGSEATDRLCALRRSDRSDLREPATDALLRIADRLAADGQPGRAAAIFHDIHDSSETDVERIASLRGIAATERADAMPLLLDVIRNDRDAGMRRFAARLTEEIPGSRATSLLLAELDGAKVETSVLLLDALGSRGDKSATQRVVTATTDSVPEVRVAALRALERLGDASLVMLLAEAASISSGEERAAARETLSHMRGEAADEQILASVGDAESPVRVELIKALHARASAGATPVLLKAARSKDEAVRVAAMEALGDVGREADLPAMVNLLVTMDGDDARQAAEDAVVNVCRRIEDDERRTKPVVEGFIGAPTVAEASLIRVLGRLGGERALAIMRATVNHPEEEVRDATIRVLADWSTAEVMNDLLDIAKTSDDEVHRVLALRGYVRLVRLPSDREPEETFRLLKGAMILARQVETKKQVLAALGGVMHLDALHYALSYLGDPELTPEAAAAALEIARSTSAEHLAEALSAVEQVRAVEPDGALGERADEATTFIKEHRGYCVRWMFSGPYEQEGKSGADLIDVAFPPEDSDAPDVEWSPLRVTDAANPWAFDLSKSFPASECCAYVRTRVWANTEVAAQLLVGSDDGVKAWLNGDVVHSHAAGRGLTCGEDVVDVTLAQGWNELLLKITQGGGAWGVCCGVRAPDGEAIDGLKFEAG